MGFTEGISVSHSLLFPHISPATIIFYFFFQAEDGIRDADETGVQTCALPILLLQEGEPGGQHPQPLLGAVDPLAERLVLGLELDHPLARFLQLGAGDHTAARLRFLQFGLGLEAPAAPRGQLLGEAREDPLEFGQRRQIRTVIGVCHSHSPVRDPPSRRWMPNSSASAARSRTSASSTSLSRSVRSGARKPSRNATLRVPDGSSGPR